jgi:hypothetical protein
MWSAAIADKQRFNKPDTDSGSSMGTTGRYFSSWFFDLL